MHGFANCSSGWRPWSGLRGSVAPRLHPEAWGGAPLRAALNPVLLTPCASWLLLRSKNPNKEMSLRAHKTRFCFLFNPAAFGCESMKVSPKDTSFQKLLLLLLLARISGIIGDTAFGVRDVRTRGDWEDPALRVSTGQPEDGGVSSHAAPELCSSPPLPLWLSALQGQWPGPGAGFKVQ